MTKASLLTFAAFAIAMMAIAARYDFYIVW